MVQLTTVILAALAAAFFTLAAPVLDIHGHQDTPVNTALAARFLGFGEDVNGGINFFSQPDCENPCHIDPGWCLPGVHRTGDLNTFGVKDDQGHWTTAWGEEDGCWDVPAGTISVSLTVSDGRGYTASNKNCADKAANHWDGAKVFPKMNSGAAAKEPWECNGADKLLEEIASISYNWKPDS